MEGVFQLARHYRVLPDQVLAMDGELYLQWREYLRGFARGQQIVGTR